MCRESTINRIIRMRKRYNELIQRELPREIYRTLAVEFEEEEHTIAAKVHLYGYYQNFKSTILQKEKRI